jgi:hypothetical protein
MRKSETFPWNFSSMNAMIIIGFIDEIKPLRGVYQNQSIGNFEKPPFLEMGVVRSSLYTNRRIPGKKTVLILVMS